MMVAVCFLTAGMIIAGREAMTVEVADRLQNTG